MKYQYSLHLDDLARIVHGSEPDLARLRGAHIFLTGCTGFLGRWIIEALLFAEERLHLDIRLSVLTRSAQKLLAAMPHWDSFENLCIVEGSVTRLDADGFSGVTHMIHGANHTNNGDEDWALEHMDTACGGTRNMLELARIQGCSAMLLLSSGAVYGLRSGGGQPPFAEREMGPEDYLQEPNVYAVCKYFEEMYTAAYGRKHHIRIPIARLFTVAGAHMPLHGRQALSSFLCDALHRRDIVIQGDGTAVRSYMYAADMVVWLLALLSRGEHGKPYNVGSDVPITIAGLAEAVKGVSGKNVKIATLGKPAPGNAPSAYVPDVSAMASLLENPACMECSEALSATWRQCKDMYGEKNSSPRNI